MAIASFIKWNLLFFVLFALAACSGGGDDDSSVVPRDAGSVEGYHIVEGDSDSSPLTLYFISPVDGLINYNTFNISAAAQSDYLPIEGTLQVEKDKEYAFYVTIYGDEKVEGTESFGINFIDTKGMSLGTVIGQIVNDDLPSVSSNSPEITETDIGTSVLSFEISLSEPVVDSYSLTVNTISFNDLSGPQKTQFPYVAMPDEDYERFDQIITFENGEINKTININVISENIVEEDEVVLLEFIDDEGTSVIQGRYAIGTIRSDETKDNNGFYLQYEGQPGLKNILEGTPSENEADTWKKINLPISIIEPDNIKQEQILVFNILNLTEAQNKGYISQTKSQSEQSALEESYISTTNNADICFNIPIELDTSDCEISTEYSLLTEDKSLQLEFYVRGDNFRELDETYIIALGNDQGVNFTNISGSIQNDDSERINIFYKGEYKDLIEFTNAGEIYEVNEPSGNTDSDVLIDFQIPSALQIKYDLEYSVSPYTGNGTAAEGNKDYDAQQSNVEGVLNFEKGIGLQTRQLALTLKGDGQYDGDKELKITFKNTSIEPLIIRIKDSDFPSVNIYKNQNADPIDNISQLDVFEPLESQSNQDEVKEYLFYLRMTGAYAALSDINYNIKITSDSSRSGDANECISIGRDSTISKPDFNDDFEIYYGNPLTQLDNAEGKLVIKKGSIQSKWALRIKQDPFIECIEEFKVSFTPDSQSGIVSDDKKAEITFKIIDTDKALITVESWEIAEADTGTKAQNFQFKANKKVNAVLTPNLMAQGLTCNADDLNPPIDAATTVSFTPDNLEPIFPIYIKGDTTVEPNEACKLEISRPEEVELAADLEALIEVQYLNSNGVVIEDATHATGMIVNDDKLNISFDIAAEVTEPTNKNEVKNLGLIHWSSNNDIAENVGNIIVTFENEACINNADDCIEYSADPDAETDIKISSDSLFLNDAVFNQTNNRFEKALPISISGDDIVELLETLNVSVKSDPAYIQSIPSDITTKIVNEDKLTIRFTENTLSPLVVATNGSESGSRFYDITWGDHSVASTVPEIKFSLTDNQHQLPASLFGIASRKIQNNQSEYDYLLKFNNSFLAGNEVVLKPLNQTLSASGKIVLEMSLKEEDLIEEEEKIEVTLSTPATDYVEAFSIKQAHTIGIDDQLSVSVGFPGNYEENVGESKEQDKINFNYTITSSGEVDEDVPELKLSVINAGSANSDSATLITGDVKDYVFTPPNAVTYENNFLTLKPALSSVINEPIQLAYKIDNDNHVEQLESIVTSIKNIDVNSAYIQLAGTDVNSPNIELTHNIINEDKTDFYITQSDLSDTSAEEGEGAPLQSIIKTYTINWTNPIGKGVSNLEFDLPFLGTATKGSDYTLTPTDTSKLTIEEKLYSTSPDVYRDRFSIIKDSESVLGVDGSVSFNIEINDDTEVEGTESILASLTEYVGMAEYISFSQTNNAITHYITSEEGLTLSLTQVSGGTESNEAGSVSNTYRISWSDDIGVGVGDISLQIKFSEASSTALIATKGSDYSVTSNSNKLIIDGDTFKIKKDSDETLTKGHLDFTVRVLNNHDLVEPDETYTLEMKKITGITPTFITVDQDNKIVSHKIIDTNKATVFLHSYYDNPTDSGYENGDGNEKTKLYYSLFWDKKIASNVPDLSIKVKLGTGSSANGNATLDDVNITNYQDNDYNLTINGEDITFKSIGTELPLASSTSNNGLYFSYEIVTEDNGLVERDEDLTGSLEYISENDESKKYISLDTTYNKLDTYTILNDDKITLSLISHTTADLSKTEADEESLNYSLKWNAPVAADVPALSVTLDPSSSDGQATVDDYTVAPVDASKLTIANKTIYTFKAANKSLSVNDQGTGAVDFVISVENDLDVEMDEMLKATLADENTSFVILDGTHKSLSHKIITDGDKLPLTISRIPLAEGVSDTENEDNWNTKQYQITWPANVSVSNYVSELSLNFDLSTSSEVTEPIAIEDGDFTVAFTGTTRTNEKILIKNADTALLDGGTYTFSFDIKNDDMVEIDERIEAEFSITGDNAQYVELTNSSLDKIIHKIKSEDKTTLSVIPVDSNLTNRTSEKTEVTRTYKLSSTNPISKDVPDIKINLSMTSGVGYAQSNSDYDFLAPVLDNTGDVYTSHKQGDSDTSDGQLATFSITTKTDDLVEYNETFEATLSLNSGTDYAVIDTDASKNTVSHTIENDDFIEIYLTDNTTIDEPIGSEPETLVDVYWNGANLDSGLPEIKYTLEVTGDISSTDYNVLSSPNIDLSSSTLEANNSGSPILDVLNDRFIENNEKLNVKLKFNGTGEENDKLAQFFRFSKNGTFVNDYEYTINDSDYFEITTQSLLSQGSPSVLEETTQLLENGEYHLKLCIPVGLSIQDTEVPFDIDPLLTNTFSGLGRTLKQATTDDYVFDAQAGTSIDLASGFVNGCKTQKLLTAKDKAFTVDASAAGSDTSQNTSFKMEFNTSDVRCNGGMCIDEQFVTIMNDDLVNLLDSGLNECVYSENRLFDLPCKNGDIPGSYQYQDAAVTDFYPRLSYTYINENGNAVATKPADNTKMCFQDNSTGLIFSSSSEFEVFNEANTVTLNTCALNEAGRSWKLPNVQELMTIMDLNPLSTSKPLINPSILGLKIEGTNFSDAHSRYWSQDSCAINGIADGRWTVDFISGHLTCNDINDSNFFIKVYR